MTTGMDELADHRLPVRRISQPLPDPRGGRLTLLLAVTDPDDGLEVLVRWRVPPGPRRWGWYCVGCSRKTRHADACEHTFAAALHLADELLGLRPAGTAPATTDHEKRNYA